MKWHDTLDDLPPITIPANKPEHSELVLAYNSVTRNYAIAKLRKAFPTPALSEASHVWIAASIVDGVLVTSKEYFTHWTELPVPPADS